MNLLPFARSLRIANCLYSFNTDTEVIAHLTQVVRSNMDKNYTSVTPIEEEIFPKFIKQLINNPQLFNELNVLNVINY